MSFADMITLEDTKAMIKILIGDAPPCFVVLDAPVFGTTEITVDGCCTLPRD